MRRAVTIAPTTPDHVAALGPVVDAVDLFPTDMLPDLLAPHLAGSPDVCWLTALGDDGVIGFCYARQEDLAPGTWNMLALGVLPSAQGQGAGTSLVAAMERRLAQGSARIVIVDTSGSAAFAAARQFYQSCGFAEEARIRDFWAEGDDKVTFRKRLT